MKKLAIVGASHFVNRMFEACGNYQWAREFLKNSLEAEATRVEFGIEWQAVEKFGVYRRTVSDNGIGMNRDELLRFFSTLGEGAKRIGGVHDNFGVGAKIASLPWNPEGVVVISYKDGRPSMIKIELDPDSADYQLVEFQSETGSSYVINPADVEWGTTSTGPPSRRSGPDHGTTIVLLGSEEAPDTVLGNPKAGESDIKGLSVYLNSRFWDLTSLDVVVVELRNERKTSWPTGPDDRDDARRPNNRRIMGAKHYPRRRQGARTASLQRGRCGAGSIKAASLRTGISGKASARHHSYAKKPGYIAVNYKDELFELTNHKAHFRWFGIAR